jgi:protein-S-isoprenylcysteine O-methyltransferase Ste14
MEIINLLLGMALVVSMGGNLSGAKRGLKTTLARAAVKPGTYLQKIPTAVSAIIFILIVCGIFGLGTFDQKTLDKFLYLRVVGLLVFSFFAWLQVYSYKSLKENYAPEIVILKNHNLVTTGIYKFIRHPQYLSQVLSDLGAGLALMNFLVLPAVILLELPLLYLRAKMEDEIMLKYFGDDFTAYKKRSGFFIPFIG